MPQTSCASISRCRLSSEKVLVGLRRSDYRFGYGPNLDPWSPAVPNPRTVRGRSVLIDLDPTTNDSPAADRKPAWRACITYGSEPQHEDSQTNGGMDTYTSDAQVVLLYPTDVDGEIEAHIMRGSLSQSSDPRLIPELINVLDAVQHDEVFRTKDRFWEKVWTGDRIVRFSFIPQNTSEPGTSHDSVEAEDKELASLLFTGVQLYLHTWEDGASLKYLCATPAVIADLQERGDLQGSPTRVSFYAALETYTELPAPTTSHDLAIRIKEST